ncbi:hypothetical protein HYC85_017460, partial [Camellia sinensis]
IISTTITTLASKENNPSDFLFLRTRQPFLQGTNRFLAQSPRVTMKCDKGDKYPRVCALKGSFGHDCCNKRCVNVMTDKFNCGKCGKKCKYSEMCCGGECANPSVDEKHCGNCNMKCKTEGSCVYGMCSYDY